MRFYPEDAPVPDGLQTGLFVLRPLRTTDVELDYEAVMGSREMLRRWAGGSWPSENFTLQGNLDDLTFHEEEHRDCEAFTFTVISLDGAECLGCVYIDPLERLLRQGYATEDELASVGADEAVVRFWARQSRLVDSLDEKLLEALEAWFPREWSFGRVLYRTNANDLRQVGLLTARGHPLLFTVEVPGIAGPYLVFS